MSEQKQPQSRPLSDSEGGFVGFRPLQSNTTYTPNQFFDVCLPHCSRGCIRIVGYMIRRTLGWCDADGNPQESQIQISWRELIEKARISRGALGPALKEAVEKKFIICSREGKKDKKGVTGNKALYRLNWDEETSHYEKNPEYFMGFYAHGQGGNRTDIPNQYFDIVLPTEPLAVAKLVGVIMRFSIGFQNATGARRQRVALAYSQICKRVNIASRSTVSEALKTAIAKNYIEQLVKGGISITSDQQITSVYGVKWTDGKQFFDETGSEIEPESRNVPQGPVQKSNQTKSRGSSKTGPAERFKNRTDTGSLPELEPVHESDQKTGSESGLNKTKLLKKTLINENLKQQQPVAAEIQKSISLLLSAGFEQIHAEEIASLAEVTAQGIQNQMDWLDYRNPSKNRLGLLRRAIEGNWERPEQDSKAESPGYKFASAFYEAVTQSKGSWQEPSQNDLTLGSAFLEELGTEKTPEQLGLAFGKFCVSSRMDFISLACSLRSRGPAFLKSHRVDLANKRHEHKLANQAQAERDAIEKEKLWNQFVLDQEAAIQKSRPEDYSKFLASREKERRELEAENADNGTFARLILNMFDSEPGRIGDIQKFFATEIPSLEEFQVDRL